MCQYVATIGHQKNCPNWLLHTMSGYHIKLASTVILLSTLVASALTAQAQPIDPYFSTTVPVRSQAADERQYAAQKGIQEVLVRLSGSEGVLQSDQIQDAVGKALNYVEQFQYQEVEDPELLDKGIKESIQLRFSPRLVKEILTRAKQPYWPVNRPSTLVWLVEDSVEEGKQLLNASSDEPLVHHLLDTSKLRGLPVQFPILDIEDQINLNADQVWLIEEGAIFEASKRYNADVILVGRFSTTSRGELWATWQFFHDGFTQVYDHRTEAADELGQQGVLPIVDYLVDRYSIIPRLMETPGLVMQLRNVDDFREYRGVMDYLQSMAVVTGLAVTAIRNDTLQLRLETSGDVDRFMAALALDSKMKPSQKSLDIVPIWQRAPMGSEESPLEYVWLGK